MKNKLVSALLTIIVAFNLISIPSVAEAYYKCRWHHGHQVCWHTGHRHHCKWVGNYYHKRKVCW